MSASTKDSPKESPEPTSTQTQSSSTDQTLKKTNSKVLMIRQTLEQMSKSTSNSPKPVVKKKTINETFKKLFGFWHYKFSEQDHQEGSPTRDTGLRVTKSAPLSTQESRHRSSTVTTLPDSNLGDKSTTKKAAGHSKDHKDSTSASAFPTFNKTTHLLHTLRKVPDVQSQANPRVP